MEWMKAPPRSPRYWPIVAILGITALLICGGGLLALAIAGRQMVDRVSRQVVVGEPPDDVFTRLEAKPDAKVEAKWVADQLYLVLEIRAGKEPVKDLVLESVLLDKYLPGIKLPRRLGPVDTKHPAKLKISFPGFDGRGGKYAKLNLRYSVGNVSMGEDPDIYIPLKAKSQR